MGWILVNMYFSFNYFLKTRFLERYYRYSQLVLATTGMNGSQKKIHFHLHFIVSSVTNASGNDLLFQLVNQLHSQFSHADGRVV